MLGVRSRTAIVVLSVVLVAAGCSRHGTRDLSLRTASNTPGQSPRDQRVIAQGEVPQQFARPAKLVGSPTGAGVYFWSSSKDESRIFLWDDNSHTLKSWAIGSPTTDDLPFTIDYGIAAAPDGLVWLGVDHTLVRLDPSTGNVTRWSVPLSPVAGITRRPRIVIHSVSVDMGGRRVAVAETGATQVQVLSYQTGTFDTIPVPTNTEAMDVAYLRDGALAVGLLDGATRQADELMIVPKSATAHVVHAGAEHLLSTGEQIIASSTRVDVLSEGGAVQSSEASPDLAMDSAPAVMPDGRVAAQGQGSIVVMGANKSSTVLPLGTVACPMKSGQARGASDTCQVRASLLAADAAGNLWTLLSNQSSTLFVVAHGTV